MSTEHSTRDSTEPVDQLPDEVDSCPVCSGALERRSQESSPNRQTIYFGCSACRVGTVAILDQEGPLSDRCRDRLERAQSRAMTGLTAHRVAAFITDAFPDGCYTIQRTDEHQFTIELPKTASPWDVLRLVELLSVGPLSAVRHDGDVLVSDTRWSSVDVENEPDTVADGGVVPATVDDESPSCEAETPFVVRATDEPRTKRAKTEDMDVSLLQKGGIYEVHSASDSYYDVDIVSEECSCPDTADRCKHLRRVDLEIEGGLVPRPDGRLP